MVLSRELLEKLACPRCKGEMDYHQDKNRLDCHQCRLSYRVVDDIPVLLIDEAKTIQ